MNSKRVAWLLLGAIVLLVVAGAVAIHVPYQREKAALEEFERHGVAVDVLPHDTMVIEADFHLMEVGFIQIAGSGPRWMRNRLGDEWMRPFDRVSSVILWRDARTMPDELRRQLLPLLLRLRSIEELGLSEGLLADGELRQLHERFPTMRILIIEDEFPPAAREWTPPPR